MTAALHTSVAVPSLRDLFSNGPSIRGDISNEVYHADRSCVSVSSLKQLLRSPAHFRAHLDGQRHETPAMFFGTAIHARLLEPDLFAREYVVAPTGDKRTSESKAFHLANADKRILTADQAVAIEGIARNVAAHSSLSTLLRAGLKEQTIIWQDQETGIWLKIRPDCLCSDLGTGICLDVKSTDDASPAEFPRACVNFDYDLQSAVYRDGLLTVFRRDFDFCFGAVEKSEPYGVALYGAPDEMLIRGRRRFRRALAILQRCLETDEWPSYQPFGDYEILEWPRWAA